MLEAEAAGCRKLHLLPQEGSSSAERREKLTEAEMERNEFKCLVSVIPEHFCSSGYSFFDYSLTVMSVAFWSQTS